VRVCDTHHEEIHARLSGRYSNKELREATQAVCGIGPWTLPHERAEIYAQRADIDPDIEAMFG
jgi:hypothetical protein